MFKNLDPILHTQLRLAIVSHLVANKESDFNELKEVCGATSGNLSIQIKKLETAEYIKVAKSFKNNYQHTSLKITKKGLSAFEKYVDALKSYFK